MILVNVNFLEVPTTSDYVHRIPIMPIPLKLKNFNIHLSKT